MMSPCIPKGGLLPCRNSWRSALPKTGQRIRSGSTWMKIWVMIPTPSTELTTFLVGNPAKEWDNGPGPSISLSVDPPQLPHSGGHLHHPTHTGGACLKAPMPSATAWSQSQSQIKGMPDLVDHLNQWIKTKMDRLGRHPHWWKEIWAIQKYTLGRYTMGDDLSKPKALYLSQWQDVAFRLPLTQHVALGWWDPPPSCHGLCTHDFLPHADASGQRDIWIVKKEKTLALSQVLQCCVERLEVPTGVLCNAIWELQKCITTLMSLNGDDIVEVSLLETTGDKPSWGKNWSCWRLQRLLQPPGKSKTSQAKGTNWSDWWSKYPCPSTMWTDTLSTPVPSTQQIDVSITHVPSKPCHAHPRKQRNPGEGLNPKVCQSPTQKSPLTGSGPTSRRVERYLTGGGNSDPFATRMLSLSMILKSKPWLAVGCGLQADHGPRGKAWLVECSALPGVLK